MLSRREFLTASAFGVFFLGLKTGLDARNSLATAKKLADWAAALPPDQLKYPSTIDFPNPGWLESRAARRSADGNIPPLIQIDTTGEAIENGHKQILMDVVTHDEIFNNPDPQHPGIMQSALGEFFASPPADESPLQGDAFVRHVGYASQVLVRRFPEYYRELAASRGRNTDPQNIIADLVSGDLPDRNVPKIALYSLATLYSPYLTADDIRSKFRVQIHPSWFDNPKTAWWIKTYKSFPKGFPVKRSEGSGTATDDALRIYGGDRTVHLWQFAFLSSKLFENPQHKRVPRFMEWLRIGRDEDEQVCTQAMSIGAGLEGDESMQFIKQNLGLGKPKIIDEEGRAAFQGIFDTLVPQDFWADYEGYAVARMIEYGTSVREVRRRLNREKLNKLPRTDTIFSNWGRPNSFPRLVGNIFDSVLQYSGN